MMKSAAATLLFVGGSYGAGWDYDHMEDWAHHFEFCGTSDQSPINIQHQAGHVHYDSSVCSPNLNWTVDWTVHDFKIKNAGHSIVVKAVEKLGSASTLTGDISDDYNNNYLTIEDPIARLPNYFKPEGSDIDEFCLDSFHFHWGLEDDEGSEHLLDDIAYPLEVHFVHYACKRGQLGGALAPYPGLANVTRAQKEGIDYHELAVVGIFFDISEYDNPAFDSILSEETLEKIQQPGDWEVVNRVYLQDIIPSRLFSDGYFSYEGSLTTPPCTNIVRWHVSNTRSYIGKNQMARFRDLMYTMNKTQAPNYRDPQLNVKPVYACMDKPSEEEKGRDATTTAVVWLWAVVILLVMICFVGVCYYKSVRDAKMKPVEPEKAKRNRLQSKSSIGVDHDTTPGGH